VPQNKLVNPVNLRLDELAPRVKSWNVDAVICALGTTKAKAGSQEAFRYVDYTLPLVFAKAAHGASVETFALVSAIGAATNSMFFYARTKGEVERDIQQIGFRSFAMSEDSCPVFAVVEDGCTVSVRGDTSWARVGRSLAQNIITANKTMPYVARSTAHPTNCCVNANAGLPSSRR